MFEHVLVPLDGSAMAEAALPVAVGGRITLLHVVETSAPATIHGQPHLQDAEQAGEYLRDLAGSAAASGNVTCRVRPAGDADVPACVAAEVEDLGVELVVMARHGSSGLRGVLFGRVAEQVASRADVPVLLVSAAPPDPKPPVPFDCRRILIPHEGEPAHNRSLPAGLEFARLFHAAVCLVAVVPTRATLAGAQQIAGKLLPGVADAVLEAQQKEAVRHLQRHVTESGRSDVEVNARVLRGDPARSIVKAAAEFSADVIVLSTHGKAGTNAFWSGSTAARVCARTESAILLVPAGKEGL